MKKIFLCLCSIFCIAVVSGCGTNGTDKLAKKITKENLVFVQKEKSVCDTELTVQNKLELKSEKDSDQKYIGEYQFYDCGDGAVYMTLSNGVYEINGKTIKFKDQYDQEYTFKITSGKEISLLDKSGKELKKFKLETSKKTK